MSLPEAHIFENFVAMPSKTNTNKPSARARNQTPGRVNLHIPNNNSNDSSNNINPANLDQARPAAKPVTNFNPNLAEHLQQAQSFLFTSRIQDNTIVGSRGIIKSFRSLGSRCAIRRGFLLDKNHTNKKSTVVVASDPSSNQNLSKRLSKLLVHKYQSLNRKNSDRRNKTSKRSSKEILKGGKKLKQTLDEVDWKNVVAGSWQVARAIACAKAGMWAAPAGLALSCIPIVVPSNSSYNPIFGLDAALNLGWSLTERASKLQKSLMLVTIGQGSVGLWQTMSGDSLSGGLGLAQSALGMHALQPRGVAWLPTFALLCFMNGGVGGLNLIEAIFVSEPGHNPINPVNYVKFIAYSLGIWKPSVFGGKGGVNALNDLFGPLFGPGNGVSPEELEMLAARQVFTLSEAVNSLIQVSAPLFSFLGVYYGYEYLKELRSMAGRGPGLGGLVNLQEGEILMGGNNNNVQQPGSVQVGTNLTGLPGANTNIRTATPTTASVPQPGSSSASGLGPSSSTPQQQQQGASPARSGTPGAAQTRQNVRYVPFTGASHTLQESGNNSISGSMNGTKTSDVTSMGGDNISSFSDIMTKIGGGSSDNEYNIISNSSNSYSIQGKGGVPGTQGQNLNEKNNVVDISGESTDISTLIDGKNNTKGGNNSNSNMATEIK